MTFPTIPTGSQIISATQADTTATRTGPNLNTLTSPAGELIVAVVFAYQSSLASGIWSGWTNGFTEFGDFGAANLGPIGCAYKRSGGAETGTVAVTQGGTVTGHATMIVASIPGAHATTAPEAGGYAQAASANADSGALDPAGWAAEDTLWIAAALCGETATTGAFTGMTTAPVNYSGYRESGITADVVGGIGSAVAFRQLNAASEDPGAWTNDVSQTRYSAVTIAVRPAPFVAPPFVAASPYLVGAETRRRSHYW